MAEKKAVPGSQAEQVAPGAPVPADGVRPPVADVPQPAPEAPVPAPEQPQEGPAQPVREQAVVLRAGEPHDAFDLSGFGLDTLTRAGTSYAPGDADRVRTLGRKYGVRVLEADQR